MNIFTTYLRTDRDNSTGILSCSKMKVLCLALTITLVSSAAFVSAQYVEQVTTGLFQHLMLSCDLTAYKDLITQEPLNVSWETMGKDVVRFDGQTFLYGPLFGDRVKALWHDMALTFYLSPVVLSDADVYECLWYGKRTLHTVIVTVVHPYTGVFHFNSTAEFSGNLPCYGRISKSSTLEKVSVYWKKDGKVIYNLIGGKPLNPPSVTYNKTFMDLDRVRKYGDLSLQIRNLSHGDTGTYECLYRDNNFAAAVPGIPKAVILTVKDDDSTAEMEPLVVSSDTSLSDTSPSTASSTPMMYVTSASTQQAPLEVTTEMDSQRAEVFPEMQHTSVPEITGTEEDGPPLPWVLIGIITGVLVITVLVLGPLMAMGKI